ncbi:glycogen debranching protein GlgX [Burkholderia plantarii]|uniref:glycogen debranching protein GlgX n=1 Tax=Burkholderia plantarii TaxID=41899 RepID=UPI0006D8C717|nr:glycogen debranching protein GlgX [Burkholderia plantarii]ALK33162.1 Glycogen debranching enzyme GlgX [Burkholderia plantarii]GLZ23022.1 glycogen operon protein GlgX homolog [Burkholderia plantarii]
MRAASADRLEPGRPYPLGASWNGLGINFAVFSAHATRLQLCLFEPSGRKEIARLDLPECTDEIWHGYLPGAHPGTVYAFRADGPYQPQHGHRFNSSKLLLDPYARKLIGQFRWSDALFGYRLHSNRADLSIDRRDSAPAMPKCVVVDESFDWHGDRRPEVPWQDTVIYETHVRGISMRRDGLRTPERGTFATLASPEFIDHLLKLGVTTVELLPVQAFLDSRELVNRGLRNYWGYDTLAYFAPQPSYLATRRLDEMRIAIRQLHAAGIEVLLDVVYNHTCEGNQLGPTLSWRGLDNASYYRLQPNDPRYHIDETGCGNTLNLSHPRVLQMVMDSLRYWCTAFNIDGFRFDLGVTLGREPHGYDRGSGFFDALRQDPVLATRKLISEPWDLGPGGYQLGNHPAGFGEWNDKFRDTVRRFWRGDAGMRPELAARLAGSADLFNHHRRKPWASVNFISAHDGFTLADLVSYSSKRNEANGEENRDGRDDNCSANWGVEGPTDDAAILEVRERVARSMLTTLFAALGTPMLLGGDEFGRSQQGNNNAYCQDTELAWFDWEAAASDAGRQLTGFVARLAALRRDHPLLSGPGYPSGDREAAPGLREIDWFDERGEAISIPAWQNRELRALTMRRVGPDRDGETEVLLLMLNGSAQPLVFVPPAPPLEFRVLADSARPDLEPQPLPAGGIELAAHAAVIAAARLPAGQAASLDPARADAAGDARPEDEGDDDPRGASDDDPDDNRDDNADSADDGSAEPRTVPAPGTEPEPEPTAGAVSAHDEPTSVS